MKPGRPAARVLAACGGAALLAACSLVPPRTRVAPFPIALQPEIPRPVLSPLAPAALVRGDAWTDLVGSFALSDCGDSRLIDESIALYTRSPRHLQQRLQRALPLLQYVQGQLQAAGIPGEFALLPLIESDYNPRAVGPGGGPRGLWQMLPATGRTYGLLSLPGYDGLRDPVASTAAAIQMLQSLYAEFGDWRLVNMAYNAGPRAIGALLRKREGVVGQGAIPDLDVSRTTLVHSARLRGLACVLRDPGRFRVQLPPAPDDSALTAIVVQPGAALRELARRTGLAEARLRALNPGYSGASVPTGSPCRLLVPAAAALRLEASTGGTTGAVAIGSNGAATVVDPRRKPADLPPRG